MTRLIKCISVLVVSVVYRHYLDVYYLVTNKRSETTFMNGDIIE